MLRLFLSLILIGLIGCTDVSKKTHEVPELNSHRTYSAEELKEDFKILTTTLKEAHPDLYRVNSKETIENKIASIEAKLQDSLSYLQFLKLMAPLLTDIGCINTQWGHSREYIEFRNQNIPVFPISIKIIDQRFFIDENFSDNDQLVKGDEILSINGESISDYLQKNYPLLPIDGKIRSMQHKWLEMAFPKHHSNFWEQADSFKLVIQSEGIGERTETVDAKLVGELIPSERQNKLPLNFEVKDSMAILKIATLNNDYIRALYPTFTHFLDSVFQIVKEDQLQTLILDLRDNAWGSMENGAILHEYLTDRNFQYAQIREQNQSYTFANYIRYAPQLDSSLRAGLQSERSTRNNAYTGKLYLLSNGWNVDATGFFCAKIKNRPNTFFAGEQAGASSFGMNALPLFLELPNTKISLYIPTTQFIANQGELGDTKGIQLDYPINDDDSLMNRVLNLSKF